MRDKGAKRSAQDSKSTPAAQIRDQRQVLIVDHTALPGGAELALPRIAQHTRSQLRFLFLAPNYRDLGFPDRGDIIGPNKRLSFFEQVTLLRKQLRSGAYAAVISNTLRAAVLVTVANSKVPHFLYLQDGADRASLSNLKRFLLQHLVMPRVSRVLPNSLWTGNSLGPKHASKVTPPVYSPSGSGGISLSTKERPRDQTPLRLLSLSRIVEWKGLHVVIEALSVLANDCDADCISLTVAGGSLMGPDKYLHDLVAKAQKLPFAVNFVGHQDDIAGLLRNHDVLIHASIRPEPFGQVIVQGLSSRLVVVASDAGGPAEIINDGESGLLYGAGDAHAMAERIRLLLREPTLRNALVAAGVERAATFSDSAVVAQFDEQLELALAQQNVLHEGC